jgi:S-adenosylmethionine hydrolase
MGAVITLTTDFGLADGYVAAMKGVILGINPEAQLVDISHAIRPQNIPEAAFVLSTVYSYFPKCTVHLVVVDPGVGTRRRGIILKTSTAYFVAPDNGVLSYVVQDYSGKEMGQDNKQSAGLPPGLEAVSITRPQLWRSPVSTTFHGRDIFAPVAAHISLGLPLRDFGETLSAISLLPLPAPHPDKDGALVGSILHIDSFGNLITSIKSRDLPEPRQKVTVEIRGQLITGLSTTYAEGDGLLALIGSSDYLEISLKTGSAHAFTGAKVGDAVRIRRDKGGRK